MDHLPGIYKQVDIACVSWRSMVRQGIRTRDQVFNLVKVE